MNKISLRYPQSYATYAVKTVKSLQLSKRNKSMAVYVCTRKYVYRLTPEPFLNRKMEEAPSFLEEN